ncbi:type II secretion system protein [Patescibacteria group bacterium]
MKEKLNNKKGFTLVELLVVIGIIVILLSVILIAVDPAKRLSQARDAVRHQDVRGLLEATTEYIVDNNGSFPAGLDSVDTGVQVLGTGASCGSDCAGETVTGCLDLSASLVEDYLAAIPQDPLSGTEENTGYAINKTAGNRISIVSCTPEIATEISAQR